MAKIVVRTRLGVACRASSSFVTLGCFHHTFGCQIVEISRLSVPRGAHPQIAVPNAPAMLVRPVAAIIDLTFIGVVRHPHLNLLLLKA